MEGEQVDQERLSGLWRRVWSTIRQYAKAMDASPMEYVFDRISYLEREVANLKNELRSRVQAHDHD
jgi:hypothetical protein